MICPRCAQENSESALYCNACGQRIGIEPLNDAQDDTLWRQFIGPRSDYYLERFRIFKGSTAGAFRPTWHWPAFGVGWLWYLYRKMYFHALVFLVGGLLPMYLGAGLVGAVIWNGFAAISANFLYYMHVKLNVTLIAQRAGTDIARRDHLITDGGGIQPYVWWLGVGIMALALVYSFLETPPAPK
jgi:hypothetical protein